MPVYPGAHNRVHRHSGMGLMTPSDVHHGRALEVIAARQQVLDAAYLNKPERFVRKQPNAPQLPQAAWINRPADSQEVTR